jgi:hypothetical protein
VNAFVEVLPKISCDEYKGKHAQDPIPGRFSAQEHAVSLERSFPCLVPESPYEHEYSESV